MILLPEFNAKVSQPVHDFPTLYLTWNNFINWNLAKLNALKSEPITLVATTRE